MPPNTVQTNKNQHIQLMGGTGANQESKISRAPKTKPDLSLSVLPTSKPHFTVICIAHKRLKALPHEIVLKAQNVFAAGTRWGSLQHSSRPPSWIFLGEEWGRKGEGKRWASGVPPKTNSWLCLCKKPICAS